MKTEEVKKQRGGRSGAGLDVNPQNINKDGRPDSGWTWRELFIKIAEEKRGQLTKKEALAQKKWDQALDGDNKAFDQIVDRMEGKAPQPLAGIGEDGEMVEGITFNLVKSKK